MLKKLKHAFGAAPAKAGYADAADMVRVVSTFIIAWYHIWQKSWLNPNFTLFGHYFRTWPIVAGGYLFVDIFLLLSGFLLMLGYLSGRNRKIGPFYASRLTRILPSYLFCVILLFFTVALGQYRSPKHMWTDLLSHLTFTHTLFYDGYYATRINGALWTLCIEMQFYFIFPYLARAFEKKPGLTYGLMMAFGLGFRLCVDRFADSIDMYYNQLPALIDVYANGMMAAYILHRLTKRKKVRTASGIKRKRPRQKAWNAWLCTALTVAAIVAIYHIANAQNQYASGKDVSFLRRGQMFYRLPLSIAGSVLLVCGSRAIGLVRWLFSNRLVRWLSGISFNFYIWHQILAVKLREWRIPAYTGDAPHKEGQQPWQLHYTLTCFAAALVVSILVTYLIEKPCAKLIKRITTKHQAKKLETAAA